LNDKLHAVKVSVIMPVERVGGDAERAIASVLRQEAPFPFELIVVSGVALKMPAEARVRNVVVENRNPATRRNRGVSAATGSILSFIDDDAFAAPGWLAAAVAYLDEHPEALALGGPDPAPEDSTVAELISDTLLATPYIGSGIAAHENRRGTFAITRPSDIALVNLFVRRSEFTGFDESIGYIGEDTALLEGLLARGTVVYHDAVRVFHRRRAFPGPYLRQRWRYRVKTGEMLARGARAYRENTKIKAFLIAAVVGLLTFPISFPLYLIATFILGVRVTRLPIAMWPLIPFAFALHHATYLAGIVWGTVRGVLRATKV
jgi:glycosyltransferase involved in cell wall biosynthesis